MNPFIKRVLALSVATMFLYGPFVAFIMYCAIHYQPASWPIWVRLVILVWSIGNFFAVMFLMRRLSRGLLKSQ